MQLEIRLERLVLPHKIKIIYSLRVDFFFFSIFVNRWEEKHHLLCSGFEVYTLVPSYYRT